MIIVTGGAGLIGSNIIAALNARGRSDILVVDHMKNGLKMRNLADLNITDYLDREDFLRRVLNGSDFGKIEAVFHQGACSDTTEWDGQFIMSNNFEYSKVLLHWCQSVKAQYLYASSASVYGLAENGFREDRSCENPINMYAYSKFQFDQYVRSLTDKLIQQVVGFRYFNVYGPREAHKGSMSSVPFHLNNQILTHGVCKLFAGTDGYSNGEQQRDFIFVEDVATANLWFFDHPEKSGMFNLGTGQAQKFNDIAQAVVAWHKLHRGINATIEYVPFPKKLIGAYQNYTQADISALRAVGYDGRFHNVDEGVKKYLDWLNQDAYLLKMAQ
jgi:ADP-L-glycero-D-manno-heptose 6-epimerase